MSKSKGPGIFGCPACHQANEPPRPAGSSLAPPRGGLELMATMKAKPRCF